ncbi:MAG: carbohydrate ABC transporter permease [Clostridiales bacterium]|uniref:Raffinose/stachyose/melibiose transport system permease protein n=1 Tax=Harryflintia acetispora TaxID=1849041 RepID=A0A9X8Y780_9FIRM|nr:MULTISPECIES: carbohydrate ABC transporter permease [Oscillospiraceae]PWM37853.1 MAG: carbohydrate ABC transporter permease [Clostridiales bacterium]RGB65721.1 carbohydrate ABC transporter permease [Harryflintia acetispora]TCL41304.1 raffinose/stachyose/melibiose transport system permease protein [Harryflintia acetispora]
MEKRSRAIYWLTRVPLILAALVVLLPFYVSFVYSVKSAKEIAFTGMAFPTIIHLENFTDAMAKSNFWLAMKNSLLTTVPTVLLLIVVAPMAAYVLGRNTSRGYNLLYSLFMAALLIPFQSIMMPLYSDLRSLGLINTPLGFVLVRSAFALPFNIMVITGFVKNVPREMEEAARIDGAGAARVYFRIVFPLLRPVVASMVVINALDAWNDFQLAVIFMMDKKAHTLPVMLYSFFGQYSVELGMAFATTTLSMIPVLAFYLLMQRHIVSGVMAGAVKG